MQAVSGGKLSKQPGKLCGNLPAAPGVHGVSLRAFVVLSGVLVGQGYPQQGSGNMGASLVGLGAGHYGAKVFLGIGRMGIDFGKGRDAMVAVVKADAVEGIAALIELDDVKAGLLDGPDGVGTKEGSPYATGVGSEVVQSKIMGQGLAPHLPQVAAAGVVAANKYELGSMASGPALADKLSYFEQFLLPLRREDGHFLQQLGNIGLQFGVHGQQNSRANLINYCYLAEQAGADLRVFPAAASATHTLNILELKVAIVTGAGTGIGKASSLALLEHGYAVMLCGRRKAPLEAVQAQARRLPGQAAVFAADVSRPADVEALFAHTRSTFGRLDLLFNNAGIGAPAVPFDQLEPAQWQQVIDINLTGAFLCAQAAFRTFKNQQPQGGRIINNGSISAHAPRPHSAPYTASKHAITGLTKSIALDGRPYRIACSQIDIGNAATPMTSRMQQGVPQADGSVKAEPTMDVTHVARMVVSIAELPLEANIPFMTIMATNMPYIGRG